MVETIELRAGRPGERVEERPAGKIDVAESVDDQSRDDCEGNDAYWLTGVRWDVEETGGLKLAMATTCLTRFSSNVTLCLRFAFSVLIAIKSSFEVNTTAGDASVRGEGSIMGLTSTFTLDGGGATFDKLTPLLTISDGIPRSLAKDNTSCSVEASRV